MKSFKIESDDKSIFIVNLEKVTCIEILRENAIFRMANDSRVELKVVDREDFIARLYQALDE